MGISRKDRVTNKEVRVRTEQHSMDDILSKRRLRWTCDTNGSPTHTSTGVALGGSGVQKGSRSSARKLEEQRQQGLVKDGREEARWQLKIDQNGVKVWPNASTWTLVESRSRSRYTVERIVDSNI